MVLFLPLTSFVHQAAAARRAPSRSAWRSAVPSRPTCSRTVRGLTPKSRAEFGPPFCWGDLGREDEALVAAPAHAQPEEAQGVDEAADGEPAGQLDREQRGRAAKLPPVDGAVEGRMADTGHL